MNSTSFGKLVAGQCCFNRRNEADNVRASNTGGSATLHNNLTAENSLKINNNAGPNKMCCGAQNGAMQQKNDDQCAEDVTDFRGAHFNIAEASNLSQRLDPSSEQCFYDTADENHVEHVGEIGCDELLSTRRSNNLGAAGSLNSNINPRNVVNLPASLRSGDDDVRWQGITSNGDEDCEHKRNIPNNVVDTTVTADSSGASNCLGGDSINIFSQPSSSHGLWNNLGDVDRRSSNVRNVPIDDEISRRFGISDEESSSGNEGEDCCVYTYKGSLQADLPNSFLTLDRIANGLDIQGDDVRPGRQAVERRSGSSSPDNEFLEMDFDPGPSLDMDESEEQEMRMTPVPELPKEQEVSENDLSTDFDCGEDVEMVVNVEPQPGPSGLPRREAPLPAQSPRSPDPPPSSAPCPPSLSHRGWSARDSWGHHCSSGDLCSPLSSIDAGDADTESLALWNSTHNFNCRNVDVEGSDTRKCNLFSDLYHCIMAKRLVMEKNASFTEVKADDDSSPEIEGSPPVERTMIWSEQEACAKQVTQISTSACGATAVINALMALAFPFCVEKVKKGVNTRLRQESAPLPKYLFSRSCAGATHNGIIRGVQEAAEGRLYARFFHMHPERRFSLSKWLSYWISKGAVPIATLNLQAGLAPTAAIPDAWHHQMIFGVSPRGLFLTNPLECMTESALMPQLCSPSELKVKRSDVLQRWSSSTDLMPLFKPPDDRWKRLNVLGQVVNIVRESGAGGSGGRVLTQHITIPASYQSGITLIMPVEAPACQELRDTPELPLLQATWNDPQQHSN